MIISYVFFSGWFYFWEAFKRVLREWKPRELVAYKQKFAFAKLTTKYVQQNMSKVFLTFDNF